MNENENDTPTDLPAAEGTRPVYLDGRLMYRERFCRVQLPAALARSVRPENGTSDCGNTLPCAEHSLGGGNVAELHAKGARTGTGRRKGACK